MPGFPLVVAVAALIGAMVSAGEAERIAEDRLPECDVIRLDLYHDGAKPMWFVETECTDGTWRDLRIDGVSGEVIAINGDYDV
ncbi:PepSY domain-containing protein [Phytomonospora endophytica]|uniref:Putative membrane protein YkoI n=1 Tax=Phytomonospora endophytica TaxID=714109 RepID=A0A841FQN8_9ACTN|nr:PepSY domain-containing protein [Phytomonospora endophytica]MBB6035872.1 putative membrane protein YkoI [Phytomonospora endophytica]GIG71133.1 hypothetical protein Pen01_74280 [Phytomonospora endophytica]